MRRCILVLEDEATLRQGMVRALAKLPQVEVLAAGTFAEARDLLARGQPDAIFSDLDLPDRNGAELLGELERRGWRIPVTFVSAYTRELGPHIPRSEHVHVVDKPVSLETLRELARAALDAGERAHPAPFGAADYLQIACIGRHSVVVTHEAAGEHGHIVVWQGEVWSAEDQHGEGLDAFRRIVTSAGAFRVRGVERDPGPRQLRGGWEHLLLDAMRLADEATGVPPGVGLFETPVGGEVAERVTPSEPAVEDSLDLDIDVAWESTPPSTYEEAIERGVAAILERDHVGALLAFEAALAVRPDDPIARANLARLAALGATRNDTREVS